MNPSRIEYIIQIYNSRTGNWDPRSDWESNPEYNSFPSLELAIAKLTKLRQFYFNSTFRLVELSTIAEVVEV